MPQQIWRFIKMPLQFPNFEKCHCNFCKLWKTPLQFANFEKRHSRLRKMPLEMAWNGIFQSLEIAVAFLGYTRFGVAFIKLTQKKLTGQAAGSLLSAARCAILSFIDYVDNGMGPRCQKSTRRSHFLLAWNKDALACVLPWPWWVSAVILSTYNHVLIVYASTW